MRWTWGYATALFSTWPARMMGAVFTVVPLSLAALDSNLRFFWLFLFAAFLALLQGLRVYQADRSAPYLSLGEPIVGSQQAINVPDGTGWNSWRGLGSGVVVRVPVSNEQGASDAQNVYAELCFAGEDGEGFDLSQPARWRDAPESREITIPGNGRPNELDLFVHFPSDASERAYVWNQESLAAGVKHNDFRISPDRFKVKVVVRGSHPKAVAEGTWRVWSRVYPEIVSDGESFSVERAEGQVEPQSGDAASED